jgi:ribosomal protein S18 acetylase RimI-like enzyme
MQIRRVRNEEAALHRFVEQCWIPYREELSEAVASHSLSDGLDVQEIVEFYLDLLDSPAHRLWVALDDAGDPATSLSAGDATFAGFVQTRLEASPEHLDWPDRLTVSNVWVHESYRRAGLTDDLLARVRQQAREDGCAELTLDVAIENERATACFENVGFEVRGFGMRVPRQDVTLEISESEPMTGTHSSIHLRRVRVEEEAMHRFVEECWVPFWEDLGDAVGEQHLSQQIDRNALVEELLEAYDVPDRRCWVALDGVEDATVPLDETDAVFAGWLNAGIEPGSQFLDPPERLFIGNLYVDSAFRGSGLADHLVLRALQYAREDGCSELSLGVEANNDRARAYYEKLGVEPHRQRMAVSIDAVEAGVQ